MNCETVPSQTRRHTIRTILVALHLAMLSAPAQDLPVVTNVTELAAHFSSPALFAVPTYGDMPIRVWPLDEPLWVDLSQLPGEFTTAATNSAEQMFGMLPVFSVEMTRDVLSGTTSIGFAGSTNTLHVSAPVGYATNTAGSVTTSTVEMWQNWLAWAEPEEVVPDPSLQMRVRLASLADLGAYSNMLLEAEAAYQAEQAAAAALSSELSFLGLAGGGMMMMMEGSSCVVTDALQELKFVALSQDTNRFTTMTWAPTCDDDAYVYGVFSLDDLLTPPWTNRAALWGTAEQTSWTDETTAVSNLTARFYMVARVPVEQGFKNGLVPSGWAMQYGLNPFDLGFDLADPDADGIANLDEYLAGTDPTNPDSTPPEITAVIIPAPNAAGWNNTNVTVSFTAVDPTNGVVGSGIASVSDGATFTGETNAAEVVGTAIDNAGNVATTSVFINLDKTPPTVRLFPGVGGTNTWSHPILAVEYHDTNTTTAGAIPAGLDLATLQITLDGVDVTTNFHIFHAGALLATNLASATPVWQVSLADLAGNVTTVSNTFVATGAFNTNAPTMGSFNVGSGTAAVELPGDLERIWLQAEVSDPNAQYGVSVNGQDGGTWDVRGNTAGGFVSLEPGTNVVILIGDAGGGNQASYLKVLVRGEHYQAGVIAPGVDVFANGQSQTYSGYVSSVFTTDGTNTVAVTNAWLNGVAVTWAGYNAVSNLLWTATIPPPANCDTFTSINLQIAWANGITNTAPLAVLECYEILEKKTHADKYTGVYTGMPGSLAGPNFMRSAYLGCAADEWWPIWGEIPYWMTEDYHFTTTPAWFTNWVTSYTTVFANGCMAVNPLDWGTNQVLTNWHMFQNMEWPPDYGVAAWPGSLGLTFGESQGTSAQLIVSPAMYEELNGAWVNQYPDGVNFITFRAPQMYKNPDGSPTTVLFTFEGLSYLTCPGQEMNLTNVVFNLAGAVVDPPTPIGVTNNSVSYLVTLQGGQEYIINENSFTWPGAIVSTTITTNVDVFGTTNILTSTCAGKQLSFTGFHNGPICGPDVTVLVSNVLVDVQTKWDSWSADQRCKACTSLHATFDKAFPTQPWSFTNSIAANAWDISPLVDIGFDTYKYTLAFTYQGSPINQYGKTVEFQGKCYMGGEVNYVLWGKMNKLCSSLNSTNFSLPVAQQLVWGRKLVLYGGAGTEQALAFTAYGFDGTNPSNAAIAGVGFRTNNVISASWWKWEPNWNSKFPVGSSVNSQCTCTNPPCIPF